MNKKIGKYLFLGVSMLLFGLTIHWLVRHFQKPNMQTGQIQRDIHEEVLRQKEKEDAGAILPVESEMEFEVKENKRVYVIFRKGEELADIIESGKLILQDEGGVVREWDLLADDDFAGEIRLPAGKYRLSEKTIILPRYFAQVAIQEEKSRISEEKRDDDIKLFPEGYELIIQIF